MKYLLSLLFLVLSLPVYGKDINEMTSNLGETKTQFLGRVAVFMEGYTASTGNEACGLIAEKDGLYSVIVQTSDIQIYCDSNRIYSGWNYIGENIHSHPQPRADGKIKLTEESQKWLGVLGMPYWAVNKKQFSEGDYKAGPGYLVTNHQLLYQNGIGTRKVVIDEIGASSP